MIGVRFGRVVMIDRVLPAYALIAQIATGQDSLGSACATQPKKTPRL
jgi:hypothetical protein